MIKGFYILLFCSVSFCYGQDNYSVYFKKEHPEAGKVKDISFFSGQYKDTVNSGATWIFNDEGIYTAEVIPLRIPKKSVRESSKYTVKEGYIFGVRENDSLPYIMQGDDYLVGIENKRLQADWKNKDSENEIYSNKHTLYLHFKEGDYYSLVKIVKDYQSLVFYEFNYEKCLDHLKKLKKTEEEKIGNNPTLIINPKSKEWQEFNLEQYFVPYMTLQEI